MGRGLALRSGMISTWLLALYCLSVLTLVRFPQTISLFGAIAARGLRISMAGAM